MEKIKCTDCEHQINGWAQAVWPCMCCIFHPFWVENYKETHKYDDYMFDFYKEKNNVSI